MIVYVKKKKWGDYSRVKRSLFKIK